MDQISNPFRFDDRPDSNEASMEPRLGRVVERKIVNRR